ncbi:hypothetical protein KVT40_004549 [Elsinoe batatas]|uniref:Uncharacterized protein n=1 Tax=Elsinoe batatas TaxID=2601811 RepID=A0A8K0L3K2_9PEZI|nr:hypothetical protein KVT40_004549 [Elsinoe batatas]
MGQPLSHIVQPYNKEAKRVYLKTEVYEDVIKALKAKFHDKDPIIANQAIKMVGAREHLEQAICGYKMPAVVRDFLENVKDKLSMLSADGWREARLVYIRHDGSQVYTAWKKRRGVTIDRFFQCNELAGGDLQVILDCAGNTNEAWTRAFKPHEGQWSALIPPVPVGWEGKWMYFSEKPHAIAMEARYPPQNEARRKSIMKLQKDGLEQLIILPPEIQQRAFSSSSLSLPKLQGRLVSHVEMEFCGTGLIEDNSMLEAFVDAEADARRRCTPLFLFDTDTTFGQSALDDTPVLSGVDELLLANQVLPEVVEIHVAVYLKSDDTQHEARIVDPSLRKCLQLTPNATKINLRIFLEITDRSYRPEVTQALAARPWSEHLDINLDLNVEVSEYQAYQVPTLGIGDGDHKHVIIQIYPSATPAKASHIFWASDHLGLIDCAMGKPMPADVLEPLQHVFVDHRRHVSFKWDKCETELFLQTLRLYSPCSLVAGEFEQCNCGKESEVRKLVEGRLVEV